MKKSVKKKLKPRSWYTKRLEQIAKELAKKRDGNICQLTGAYVTGTNAHGSHIIPKSAGLRWLFDVNNIKCLSYHSHINFWHKNPLEATAILKKLRPDLVMYAEHHEGEVLTISTASLAEFYEEARHANTAREYYELYCKMIGPYISRSKDG